MVQRTLAGAVPAAQRNTDPGGAGDMGLNRPRLGPFYPPADAIERDARPVVEERDLLERLRDGDERAFARLYETHWEGVSRLLTRLLGDPDAAGDAAQEVFVQLYRNPPDGETVPLRAWLYRVALNRGYNALRADRRRRRREEAVTHDRSGDAASEAAGGAAEAALLEAANRAEERDAVRRVLARLPERQRDCLMLRSEGLSYAEVAAALGVSPSSVGTLLARAERAFKQQYLAQRGGM